MCLFNAGICYTWSSPSLPTLLDTNSTNPITEDEGSWIASILLFGTALGPVFGSYTTRTLGPKASILIAAIPLLLGDIILIFASKAWLFLVSRFTSGIGVGFAVSSAPIYVGEVAEDHNRGALTLSLMIMTYFGNFIPLVIGPHVSISTLGWILCIFPLILFVSFWVMPDSPYHLMRMGKEDEAKKALKWLRHQEFDEGIQSEINEIKRHISKHYSFLQSVKEIRHRSNLKALLLILCVIMAQQFSGVQAVAFYEQQIYSASNIPMTPYKAVLITCAVGTACGLSTLCLVDRWGRKPLLILSTSGCMISNLLLGIYYQIDYLQKDAPALGWASIIFINALIISFSVGLGPVPLTVIGEMFSSNFKEVALSITTTAGALTSFFVAKLFGVLNDNFGSSCVFFTLSVIILGLLAIIVFQFPETKNKSLLEIQRMLIGKPPYQDSASIRSHQN